MNRFVPQNKPEGSTFGEGDAKNIITQGPQPHLMDKVEKFVEIDGKNLTSSQLRILLDTLQNIKPQGDIRIQLGRFTWKFAYMVGKEREGEKREAYTKLYNTIKPAIRLVQEKNDPKYLENLKDLFEAIVAYHRFWEKRK